MKRACVAASIALMLADACGLASALPPDRIFERVAPSVWSVHTFGVDGKPLASASGLSVAPERMVTSCRALVRAHRVELRQGSKVYNAKLEFPDVERDLCQLQVPGLNAPVLAQGSARVLRPGQRVYVIGFSLGDEASIADGLISAVRDAGGKNERVQTTVPATGRLLGAGVFDEEARLVALVTASPKGAAATVFAVPADWLTELGARGQAALTARAKSRAAVTSVGSAIPELPAAGTAWVYGFNDRIFRRGQTEFTVRVVRSDGNGVEEDLATSAKQAPAARRTVVAGEVRFLDYPLGTNSVLIELAPYLVSGNGGKAPTEIANPVGYPQGGAARPRWATTARLFDLEQVTVPAGTFRTFRVEVKGNRTGPISTRAYDSSHFTLGIWYAPDVKRYVRIEHRVWSRDSRDNFLIVDDVVELLSYHPPS